MRRQAVLVGLMVLPALGCLPELVEPDSTGRPASLVVTVGPEDRAEPMYYLRAELIPGRTPEGEPRALLDGAIRLWSYSFHGREAQLDGQLGYSWSETFSVPDSLSAYLTVSLPSLSKASSPGPIELGLRSKGQTSSDGSWVLGTPLVLNLTPAPISGGEELGIDWHLSVTASHIGGNEPWTLSLMSQGEVPDAIVIPADWLPARDIDHVEARLLRGVRVLRSSPDGSYTVSLRFSQVLYWAFAVPDPSTR